MEPRPQRPRSNPASGGPHHPASAPGGGASSQPTQHYQDRGDIGGTFIAPPRTEYDYSPLDLAPPAQRRKRQLVGGVIGALVILALGALAVFGYLLLNDDKSSDKGLAPTQTALAEIQATTTAQVAAHEGAAGTPSTVESTATVAATQPGGAPTTAATTAPTTASANGGQTANLDALLPEAETLPVLGLDVVTDSSLTEAQTVDALGASRTAEQNLKTWGWSGNATRTFTAADPNALDPGATISIAVSVHGFNSPESTGAALTFFSDILANSGWTEGEAPQLGDKVRLLTTTNEDGSVNVALYVAKGNVLYRIGGSALAGGDPTEAVLQVADMLFAADAGQ